MGTLALPFWLCVGTIASMGCRSPSCRSKSSWTPLGVTDAAHLLPALPSLGSLGVLLREQAALAGSVSA
jgi:hypothetical protein